MALAKIPNHFLNSIEIDAILLTKLRENKWDKVHEELLQDTPILHLQTQYEYPHCFDMEVDYQFAVRLPKLLSYREMQNSSIDFETQDIADILYNILTL
jgi:hypothetical protein